MRVLCLVLLPVGLLGLIDVLLLDDPAAAHWWSHDGGVLGLSVAATLIGLGALVSRPHRGDSVDDDDKR